MGEGRWTIPPVRIEDRLSVMEVGETIPEHLTRTGVPDVWKLTTGAGVRVGVIDTGINAGHEDLEPQIAELKDFTGSRSGPIDVLGHGSHVASIIGAVWQNKRGIAGVAPGVKLYCAKGLGDNGSGSDLQVVKALEWCGDQGCKIINMSLGSPVLSARIRDAIKRLHGAGVVIVCANGNDSGPVNFPGALPETISVSALDYNETQASWFLADFSSRGEPTDIAAPGVNILAAYVRPPYARLSGTSMSAPFVSGLAALLIAHEKRDDWNKDAVLDRLGKAATDLGHSGEDPLYGRGLVVPSRLIKSRAGGMRIGPFEIHAPARATDLFGVGLA